MLIIISKWGPKMKYSFIVPVYNGEVYIDRCLPSLVNQTYDNFEIIVINDGSTDKSLSKLKSYQRKYQQIKLYSTKNGGLSEARNYGIKRVKGDYLIFVDIDDYVNLSMLEYLNEKLTIHKNIDLIKYSYLKVNNNVNGNFLNIQDNEKIDILNGNLAFKKMVHQKESFESACIYAFSIKFWQKNDFKFEVGKYYEDFGLIPYIILKSKKIILTNKTLYYYVQSKNSIMRNDDYQKQLKKFNDLLFHFDNLHKNINDNQLLSLNIIKLFNSYIANAVLFRYVKLNKYDKKKYKSEIQKRNIIDLLLADTFIRKIKKIFYKIII